MKGFPVVLSENGTPVVIVQSNAPIATVSENGLGTPITPVEKNGTPLIVSGVPNPLQPGPLDVLVMIQEGFNDFSHEFTLASECAVLGLACTYDGNPVIAIEHGGQPLTIVAEQRYAGLLCLIAVGKDLTPEVAELTIKTTGGNCHQGAVRINEMQNIDDALAGWTAEESGITYPITPMTISGSSGGVVKGAFVNAGADRFHYDHVENATTTFDGYFVGGEAIEQDFSPSGPWVLGAGWSIDGDSFVHTGPEQGSISITHPRASGVCAIRANIDVTSGSITLTNGVGTSGDTYTAPAKGIVSTAGRYTPPSGFTVSTITANGDCRVNDISVVQNGKVLAWVFFSSPAANGKVLSPRMAYRPEWLYAAAEILGQDYP